MNVQATTETTKLLLFNGCNKVNKTSIECNITFFGGFMFIRSKIFRDTAILSAMQLFLDSAALLLNMFITRQLGSSAIGILTLLGSFLGLAGIISNGNAFLCTSRLISEEIGKSGGNPEKVLLHGIKLCIILSTAVSAVILMLSGGICERFFSGADMQGALKAVPFVLVTGAVSACLKGYFNAMRRTAVPAVSDVLEFAVKSTVIVGMTLAAKVRNDAFACKVMITSIVVGNAASFVYLAVMYAAKRTKYSGKCSLSFRKYISYAFPILGGGVLTAFLSSANDALIPVCLRQNGSTAEKALGSFGVFEGIVIPALFFPSVVLCSMSGIIVSETAKASAADNRERIKSLAERITDGTLVFAVFAAAVLMRFGRDIGGLLGGGDEAGRLITLIAPVVPFIYMEIVLEAMIKGMGMQAFSSLNYLAEYAVRISVVLIFVPRFGLYGVAASYYTSNVFGNCSRFIKLWRTSKMKFGVIRSVILPVLYAFMTMAGVEILMRPLAVHAENVLYTAVYILLWLALYSAVMWFIGSLKRYGKINDRVVVNNYQ